MGIMDACSRLEILEKAISDIQLHSLAVKADPALRADIREAMEGVYDLACKAGAVLHELQPYSPG